MASANTLPLAGLRVLESGFRTIKDPGAGNTITSPSIDHFIVEVVTLTAEARTLPAAGGYPVGVKALIILVTDGGDLTINGADRIPILADADDPVEFTVTRSGSTKNWTLTSDSRGGANATETRTKEILINNAIGNGPWVNSARVALTASSADPNCALIVGAHGTDNPLIRATNALTAASTEDFSAIATFTVPADYVAASLLTLTLTIVEGSECDNPDLEISVFNRDAPTSNIIASGADTSIAGGATVVATITGTAVLPGDTLDVEVNFELTDTGTLTPIYDLTRAILSYTAHKATSYVPTQLF